LLAAFFLKTSRTYIPEQLIEEFIGEDVLPLALFVKLKASCSHGRFRDLKEASKRSGVSKSVIYRLYKPLMKRGLIKKNSGGFVLATRKEINDKYRTRHCSTIIHQKDESLVSIRHSLLLKLTERAARQQHYKYEVLLKDKADCNTRTSFRKYVKRYGEAERELPRRLDEVKYAQLLTNVGFTHDYLGSLMGVSKSTAWGIIRKAKEQSKCDTKVFSKFLCNMNYPNYLKYREELKEQFPTSFWLGGNVYYNVCTLYAQNAYWSNNNRVIDFSTAFKHLINTLIPSSPNNGGIGNKYSSENGKENNLKN